MRMNHYDRRYTLMRNVQEHSRTKCSEWRIKRYKNLIENIGTNLLLRTNPSRYHMIFNTMGQREIIVSCCSHISIFHQSVMQMTIETFLYFTHIFNLSDTTNTDLFSLFNIWLWRCHFSKILFYAINKRFSLLISFKIDLENLIDGF